MVEFPVLPSMMETVHDPERMMKNSSPVSPCLKMFSLLGQHSYSMCRQMASRFSRGSTEANLTPRRMSSRTPRSASFRASGFLDSTCSCASTRCLFMMALSFHF